MTQRNMMSAAVATGNLRRFLSVVSSAEAVMQRQRLLMIVALAALAATPPAADARSRLGLFGFLSAPLGMVRGAVHARRSHRHYRSHRRTLPQEEDRVGAVGPPTLQRATSPQPRPASANLHESLIGYAVWPGDYAARFWSLGYDDVLTAFVSPGTAPPDRQASTCGTAAEAAAAQPLDRISRSIALTPPERARLHDVRAALKEAIKRSQSYCRDTPPDTPSQRLSATMDGLWAMRDTALLLRTPLQKFYSTLTDAQKAQFDAGPAQATVAGPQPLPAAPACGTAGDDMPFDKIEQSVRPTPAQRASLEMLRRLSADLSSYIAAACPRKIPTTAVGRLDVAADRIDALLYAATTIRPALDGFYLQLSDDQKKKFDLVRR
jgi:hypothetical protein